MKVVETRCNPQGFISQRENFDSVVSDVNGVLSFYGLRITEEGRLISTGELMTTVRREETEDERLFDARAFHPQVARHGGSHFGRGAYFHAVFECCKALDTAVADAA